MLSECRCGLVRCERCFPLEVPALPQPAAQTCLERAAEVVDGARQSSYGHPWDNHGTTGAMLATWRERFCDEGAEHLSEQAASAIEVCVANILQKLSRLANDPWHEDSLVDIAGYVRNIEMILEVEAGR